MLNFLSVQQTTSSPATPITRLIRCCFAGSGSKPTKTNPLRIIRTAVEWFSGKLSGNHPPGSRKTKTSPRLTSVKKLPNLLTTTRSLIFKVCSIEPEGI